MTAPPPLQVYLYDKLLGGVERVLQPNGQKLFGLLESWQRRTSCGSMLLRICSAVGRVEYAGAHDKTAAIERRYPACEPHRARTLTRDRLYRLTTDNP